MIRTFRSLFLATALAAVLGLPAGASAPVAAPTDAPPALTLLAAGDLRGEIKPCGCSPEGQQGGLPRRLSYLEQAMAGPGPRPLLVDLGNNFPPADAQGREKIVLIRELMARAAPDAVLPGPGELALGLDALAAPADPLPYVLTNEARGAGAQPFFAAMRRARRGNRSVGIYGYLSPAAVFQGMQTRLRLRPADAALLADLRARMAAAGDDATVLLFRGSDAELKTLAESGLFTRIVAGNPSADELHQVTDRAVGALHIPQVPTKGQGVLRIALPLTGAATAGVGTGAEETVPVVWLGDRWPDHPAAAKAMAAYDERVKALFFARLQVQERTVKESVYAGAAACQACHAAAHGTWKASGHGHALATLERVGKQYDPECLACHVLGLERGGFLSKDLTPQFANVQCENCHGPSKAHAAQPTTKPGPVPTADGSHPPHPTAATCRQCHRGSHSPRFDFAAYWPKIAHGSPAKAAAR